MAVRSDVLAHGVFPGNGALNVLFTCPAGRTGLLKEAFVQHAGSGPREVVLSIRRAGNIVNLMRNNALPPWDVMRGAFSSVALEPGDELLAASYGGTGNVHVHCSGALLFGAPS